jgi:hypothetical protein
VWQAAVDWPGNTVCTASRILGTLNELKCGCHAFRRFRFTHLRTNGVPEDLIHCWLGYAGKRVRGTSQASPILGATNLPLEEPRLMLLE